MAMNPRAILTTEEARAAINLPAGTTSADTQLVLFVGGITGRIDVLCGPVVNRNIEDERHDGGRTRIFLSESPAAEVTSVAEWAHTTEKVLDEETLGVMPSAAFLLDHTERLSYIWRRSGGYDTVFAPGRRNIVVNYVAGRFENTETVDDKFKLAVGSILRRLHKREASAWGASADWFANVEDAAPTVGSGFFKVFDPQLKEMLSDELRPPPGL